MSEPYSVKPSHLRNAIDLIIIFLFIIVLTYIHYTSYQYAVDYHILLQFGYYIPVIYAAMRFGPSGGIASGLVITILFLPHLAHFRTISLAAWYTQWVEIILINVIGWLTGFLIRQERQVTRRYRHALAVQSDLVEQLKREGEQRERLEQEVRRAERLTALGHLSAGLAHEIRNPLGVIQVTAQLLTRERPQDEVVGEYCRVLQEEGGRLNRMVSQFLDFARPKEPIRQRMALKRVVEEGTALAIPLLRQSKIRFEQNLGGVGEQVVEVDFDQMKQVMLNVLINAIEAQGQDGVITLEGHQAPGFVGLVVSDQGPGIPVDILPYVFDPFFTTKDKGAGLGLSVVHGIITQHGGKISLVNNTAGGIRVEILLPIQVKDKTDSST
ncbi:MAG: ATP-binding protein [Peptococcaceae bacterium]|nr:ATP-binding protein [Peptococcaceae bacterium]